MFDGSEYEYEVRLLSVTSSMVTGQVLSSRLTAADPLYNLIGSSLAKGKMDYIIQKSVELGARLIMRFRPIIPVVSWTVKNILVG